LASAVDGHEQAQLALFRAHLGDVDVEIANGVGGEALAHRLVTLDLGQAADAMPLEAAVQRRARQVWDRRLEGVETVVQRQERVPAEGEDDRLLLRREHGGAGVLGTHPGIGCGLALLPFLDRGGADAVVPGQRSHALLAPLYRATHCRCRGGASMKNLAHSASRAAW
jgi:hypothetical protein